MHGTIATAEAGWSALGLQYADAYGKKGAVYKSIQIAKRSQSIACRLFSAVFIMDLAKRV